MSADSKISIQSAFDLVDHEPLTDVEDDDDPNHRLSKRRRFDSRPFILYGSVEEAVWLRLMGLGGVVQARLLSLEFKDLVAKHDPDKLKHAIRKIAVKEAQQSGNAVYRIKASFAAPRFK